RRRGRPSRPSRGSCAVPTPPRAAPLRPGARPRASAPDGVRAVRRGPTPAGSPPADPPPLLNVEDPVEAGDLEHLAGVGVEVAHDDLAGRRLAPEPGLGPHDHPEPHRVDEGEAG